MMVESNKESISGLGMSDGGIWVLTRTYNNMNKKGSKFNLARK